MTGRQNVVIGVVLIAVGGVVSAISYASASEGGGRYVIWYGLILVGIVRLVRGLVAPDPGGPTGRGAPADDPRWHRGPEKRQVAGSPCVACEKKLMGDFEAAECPQCNAVVHAKDCLDVHTVRAHAPQAAAYR